MALLSTQVLPDNTLEEFRIEFNKLVTDVSGLSLGNTFDTQIIFEGTTDDTFETGLSVTDPTADRSIVFPDQSGNVLLDSANIALGDNIEIQFGDGTDLKIFHNGSNSIIRDNGTGSLFLEGSVVAIRNAASDETMAQFTQDGAAALYHNNVSIMSTAATGISVAGDVVATDDLILDNDGALIQFGDDQEVTLTHVHNTGVLLNAAMVVQFRDSAINIGSPADGDLDINADDEIELNSTLIDINGNVEISGTLAQADAITMATNKKIIFRDAAIHISSTADGDLSIAADDEIDITSTLIDINGNVDISGTTLMTGVATHGGNVVSDTDSTDDLGTTGVRWANLYVDAITATDQITATGFTGTLDGILGSGTAAAATTTTLASTTITASGIIKTDDATDATTTTDGSLQTDGGLSVVKDIVGGNDIDLLSDGAVIYFGADKDVQAFHIHNSGLTLRNNSTGDDTPFLLTLQTGETDIAASDVLGKIQFQAPDEGTGTDAILVAAAIQAVSEGDFSASNNATKLNFMTGASEAATTKMTLTSGGLVGIGTEAPGSELSVAGDMRIQQAGGRIFQLNSFATYSLGSSGGSAIRFVEESGSHHLDFETHYTGNSHAARMRIDKEGDVSLLTDGVALKFGLDEDVTITHDPDDGLFLKSNATSNSNPFLLTLQTGETDMAANDVMGKIQFQAPDEGTGTDAILVAAAIQAVSEGDFSSSANATRLEFMTGASEAAATKMTLTSAGKLGIGTTGPLAKNHTLGAGTAVVSSGSDGAQEAIIEGANIALTSSYGNLNIISNTAQAADTGGQIAFGGKSTDSDNKYATWSVIKGAKENGTSANIASYLAFSTRANGAGNTEKLRITSDGRGLSSFTAKAWVNFNGTGTIAIVNSHNVSSLTDVGTGKYIVNLSNNLTGNDTGAASCNAMDGTDNGNGRLAVAGLRNSAGISITIGEGGADPDFTDYTDHSPIHMILFGD